jgi:hypothetical protein
MAHNPDRFVIIDGVQYSRERAKRLGLTGADGKANKKVKAPEGAKPSGTRARTSGSTATKDAGTPAGGVVTTPPAGGTGSVVTGSGDPTGA